MMRKIIEILKFNHLQSRGCSTEEIESLQRIIGVKFPVAYVGFLLNFGKKADGFITGSSCFYDELEEMQTWAKELLIENNFKELPDKSFVIWMHQGYQFTFFIEDSGDDPPVYYYSEGRNQTDFIQSSNTLTDFFYDQILFSGLEIPSFLEKKNWGT